ncbi:insulinase family protein [Pikeienuella piscinae]|uniref:Insulinase family protein n=1 Tax=Pikeienuella piscinae TaxID=2748098 RepID=A0A7L5BZL5_9RHOB|nr:pitrilysin family protein [Pikeienuella piscinae]QIE56921.1 insulinase family protein [Pikeienuella piscinae]
MIRFLAPLALIAFALPALAAAPIQRVISPGGIEAWLVEENSIPIVSIGIEFEGGALLDPEGKEGLANLLAGLLEEGAGDLDAVGFAEAADALAARFRFSAGRESLSVSASMLAENREASVDLLRLALTEPRFDEEPLTRVKRQIASSIRSDETEPNAIAGKAWFEAAFPDDPYGRPSDGTLESVAALSADDLRAQRPLLLDVGAAHIGVVGAISAEELGPLLDRLLGDLPNTPFAPPPPATVAAPPGLTVIDLDVPQSVAVFGHKGILRDDPDFIPAYVMNYILGGGGFSSRLTEEVREKRGLAYSVYSYLYPLKRAGLVIGGVASGNGAMAETVNLVRAEWRRMAETGVSEEELEKAKRYLTGAYALQFDSNAKIANMLVGLQSAGLPINYPESRNALVEAVTTEDIQRVARRILDVDALSFVVVGRPEGLPGDQGEKDPE